MNTLAGRSLALLLLSVVFLILITVFESSLAAMSPTGERILSLLLLVLPAVVGSGLGILSVIRKEPRSWLGLLGAVLNGLFALFHIFLLSFAG